jgi:hypothetical protein
MAQPTYALRGIPRDQFFQFENEQSEIWILSLQGLMLVIPFAAADIDSGASPLQELSNW